MASATPTTSRRGKVVATLGVLFLLLLGVVCARAVMAGSVPGLPNYIAGTSGTATTTVVAQAPIPTGTKAPLPTTVPIVVGTPVGTATARSAPATPTQSAPAPTEAPDEPAPTEDGDTPLPTPVADGTAQATPEAGALTESAPSTERPTPWIPDNDMSIVGGKEVKCDWGIPSGTMLFRKPSKALPAWLTNCLSFNHMPVVSGTATSSFEVSWIYSPEDYEFLLEDWDGNDATAHPAAAWWGPLQRPDVYAMVWYGTETVPCVGTSFLILPQIPMKVIFYNEGDIPGVWSQGAMITWTPSCYPKGWVSPVILPPHK